MPWLWSSMGKMSHWNDFLRVSRRKHQILFPCGAFLKIITTHAREQILFCVVRNKLVLSKNVVYKFKSTWNLSNASAIEPTMNWGA